MTIIFSLDSPKIVALQNSTDNLNYIQCRMSIDSTKHYTKWTVLLKNNAVMNTIKIIKSMQIS